MKKNILLYTIIIVLACVLTGTTTYIIMKDNNKTEIKEENKTSENKSNEQITLSEEELLKYVSYVPNGYEGDLGAYEKNKITVNELDEKLLILKTAYNYVTNNIDLNDKLDELESVKLDRNILEEKYKEMYNKQLNFTLIENNSNIDKIINGTRIYQENNNIYIVYCMGWDIYNINLIDSYVANKNELIIYEYAGKFISDENNLYSLKDYQNDKSTDYNNLDYDEALNKAKKYLKENKTEFTKYKHTFKKNNTGYYWYSTEVV